MEGRDGWQVQFIECATAWVWGVHAVGKMLGDWRDPGFLWEQERLRDGRPPRSKVQVGPCPAWTSEAGVGGEASTVHVRALSGKTEWMGPPGRGEEEGEAS